MGRCLDPEDALAFGVDLQPQEPEGNLEDRHIVLRCLDRNLTASSPTRPMAGKGTPLSTEQCAQGGNIEMSTSSIDDSLEEPFQVPTAVEQEVTTRFELEHGVFIPESHTLLVGVVEGEAETTINPTLADLRQAPYSVLMAQGVCDSAQACGVGNMGKAVAFLDEIYSLAGGPSSDILVAIEHDHGSERWVGTKPDCEVAPFSILDMERVVFDIGPWLLLRYV